MLTRTIVPAVILGVILSIVIPFANPAIVSAQTCYDAAGAPIACPDKKKEKRPTIIYPSYTPTSTVTPTATLRPTATKTETPTSTSTPIIGKADDSPSGPESSGGSSPAWWIGLLGILLGGSGIAAYFNRRFTQPPDHDKPGGGDDQGFIVEDGKPAGDGSVKGFIIEGGKPGGGGSDVSAETVHHKEGPSPHMNDASGPSPHMQPGEVDDPNIKPGQIAGMDDWELPGSNQSIGNPDFHPGAQEPPEPNFSSKMGPQPHMQPGETQPPDPDLPSDIGHPPDPGLPSDIGIDNPNIKPPEVGVDNPDF